MERALGVEAAFGGYISRENRVSLSCFRISLTYIDSIDFRDAFNTFDREHWLDDVLDVLMVDGGGRQTDGRSTRVMEWIQEPLNERTRKHINEST